MNETNNPVARLSPDEVAALEGRIGRIHLRQRLGIQGDYVARVFGTGRNFFHIENWYSIHSLVKMGLRCTGLYWRGRRNATRLQIRHHEVDLPHLNKVFNGYTILQLSDLHLDVDRRFADALIERLDEVSYDLCVITGDFRAMTFGDFRPAIAETARVRSHINKPVLAILGNHDFIEMVPRLEDLDIPVLLNESTRVTRDGASIYLAGVDDPHYYQMDNLEKAAQDIPPDAVSVLLAHSPEIYQRAAHTDFDLMLSGHTHGGQICLPGGVAILRNARCPRRMCAGPWQYHRMRGYTSVGSGTAAVDVRLNCLPEITLHHLRSVPDDKE